MRKAYDAMKSSDDPKTHIEKALKIKAMETGSDKSANQRIRQSIRGRKRLSGKMKDETARDALRQRIGYDAFKRLEKHDEMLEAWAKRI